MPDESIGLQLRVAGDEQFIRASSKVEMLKREMADLQAAMDRGAVHGERFANNFERLGKAIDQAEKSMRQAQITATSQAMAGIGVGAAGGGVGLKQWFGNNAGQLGQATFQFGAMVEDAQYGMRAIANNLPMLAMNLGSLAGIAPAAAMGVGGLVAVLTTAATTLYNMSGSSAPQQSKRITEMLGEKTDPETEYTKRFKAAFGQGRAREVADAIANRTGDAALTERERNEIWVKNEVAQSMTRDRRPEEAQKQAAEIDKIRAKARERIFQNTLKLIEKAETDPAAAAALSAQMGIAGLNADWAKNVGAQGGARPLSGLTNAVINGTANMSEDAAFRTLIAEQQRLQGLYEQGKLSAKEYNDEQEKVQAAMEAVSDKARAASDASRELADSLDNQQRKSQENLADEGRKAQQKADQPAIAAYMQAFGGGALQEYQARVQAGQDPAAAERAIMGKLSARMSRLNPTQRARVAEELTARVVEAAGVQDMGMNAMADLQSANIAANLAPAGTRMGIMQRQMLARQAQIAGQFANRQAGFLNQQGNQPFAGLMGVGEAMKGTANEFQAGVREFREIIRGGITL